LRFGLVLLLLFFKGGLGATLMVALGAEIVGKGKFGCTFGFGAGAPPPAPAAAAAPPKEKFGKGPTAPTAPLAGGLKEKLGPTGPTGLGAVAPKEKFGATDPVAPTAPTGGAGNTKGAGTAGTVVGIDISIY
jgi:hypothetical protein